MPEGWLVAGPGLREDVSGAGATTTRLEAEADLAAIDAVGSIRLGRAATGPAPTRLGSGLRLLRLQGGVLEKQTDDSTHGPDPR